MDWVARKEEIDSESMYEVPGCCTNKEDNSVTQETTQKPRTSWINRGCTKTVQVIKPDQSTHMITGREPEDFAEGMYTLMGGFMPAEEEKTFREYTEEWFQLYHAPRIGKRWADECRILLNRHLYPFFGDMGLSGIDVKTVQRFLNDRADMAHSSQRHLLCLLRQIMDNALEDGLIRSNPAASKRLVLSRKETVRKPLEIGEAGLVQTKLSSLTLHQRRMVAFPLFAGLRRGEMLALQWKHIDLEHRLIHVRQSVSFVNNKPELKPPKSKAGIRDVPITDDLLPYLDNCGDPEVFIIGNGQNPITRRAYEIQWKKIEALIPQLKTATAHALRHTFATVASGSTDIKTLQRLLGHSKADITLNRYVHPQQHLIAETVHTLSGMYQAAKKDSPVCETGESTGSW